MGGEGLSESVWMVFIGANLVFGWLFLCAPPALCACTNHLELAVKDNQICSTSMCRFVVCKR